MDFEIEIVDIPRLKPYPRNYRSHPPEQLKELETSLAEFGWYKNVVISSDDVILAGHGIVEAAFRAGRTEVPVHRLDILSTDPKAAKLAIADNELSRMAQDDTEQLATLLREVQESEGLDGTGFDDAGLDKLLADLDAAEDTPIVEPSVPETPKEATTKLGDVWLLGEHRVMCGDSRDEHVAGELYGNGSVVCVVTSPPYHVGKAYERGQSWAEFVGLLHDVFVLTSGWVEPGGYVFVNFAQVTSHPIAMAEFYRGLFVDELEWQWHAHRVWRRPESLPFYAVSSPRQMGELEYIHTYRKPGGGQEVVRDRDTSSRAIWETGGPERLGHPAAMPVDLAAAAVRVYVGKGDSVADLFLGSGTTLIAAEQLGRRCYGIEIEPRYVDVTVRRWQELTGQQATLEATGEPFIASET